MEWENLLEVMQTQGVEGTAKAVLALTDEQRRVLAPPVAKLARATGRWWDEDNEFYPVFQQSGNRALNEATAIAAAGTLPASKLPVVLRRLWLDLPSGPVRPVLVERFLEVLEARGLTENPRFAAELARRVRDDDFFSQEWFFELALELAHRNPGEPPSHPAFTRLWLRQEQRVVADLRAHPGWSVLVLAALEARGTGRLLGRLERFDALFQWAAEGLIARADLLDACIGALQTNDRKLDLQGLLALHERLDPSGEEVRSRIGQYISLAAGAPQFVATVAQERLRALDDAGLLPPTALAQLSAAIMVRPDKALFRAQLTWLRAALKRAPAERESLILATAAGLGHPDPALQKRVLDLLTPYGGDLSAAARQELAVAAEALAPDLRPAAAGLLGVGPATENAAPALEPPAPVAVSPLIPITAPEEVAEELSVFFRSWQYWRQVDAPRVERVLDGLVRFTWSDPERLREVLEPLMRSMAWLSEEPPASDYQLWKSYDGSSLAAIGKCLQTTRACADRPASERHRQHLEPEVLPASCVTARGGVLENTLFRRLVEISSALWWAPVPVLLATPTTTDGVLEAGELVRRLELLEAAGGRPWPHDLAQAWLRVAPADRDRVLEAVRRVAGPETVERLTGLGAAGAQVGLELWTRQTRRADNYYEKDEFRTTLIATLSPKSAAPAPWDLLWTLPKPEEQLRHRDTSGLTFGPMTLPFDREAVAAHLIQDVPDLKRGGGEVIRAHGEVAGPIGPASLLLYCYGLNLPAAEDRAGATEALIAASSRGELDPRVFGWLLGQLVADRTLKLNRLVEALRGVGQAGAWRVLWESLAAALPLCLPRAEAEPVARLADLLVLAVEAAQFVAAAGGAVPGEVEGLAEVADRRGASRLRSEARRLRETVSGARAS